MSCYNIKLHHVIMNKVYDTVCIALQTELADAFSAKPSEKIYSFLPCRAAR